MPNYQPKVSVVIPVYNTADYLRETLNSICDQTLKELEIILLNDGSTDDSMSIIEDFAARDSRIQYHVQPNQGLSVARNQAMRYATGKYIYFMDSDDIFLLPLVMSSDVYQTQQKEPIYVLVQLNTLKMWVAGAEQVVVNKTGNGKISVAMNAPISDNQPVKLTVDNSLIESYNTENGTSFIPFEQSR